MAWYTNVQLVILLAHITNRLLTFYWLVGKDSDSLFLFSNNTSGFLLKVYCWILRAD